MELNWQQWKIGLVMAAIQAGIVFCTNFMVFKTPPNWFSFLQLAVMPAALAFLATLVQKCLAKPEGRP